MGSHGARVCVDLAYVGSQVRVLGLGLELMEEQHLESAELRSRRLRRGPAVGLGEAREGVGAQLARPIRKSPARDSHPNRPPSMQDCCSPPLILCRSLFFVHSLKIVPEVLYVPGVLCVLTSILRLEFQPA